MSQESRQKLLFIETTRRKTRCSNGSIKQVPSMSRHLATRLIEARSTSTSSRGTTTNPRKRTRTKHEFTNNSRLRGKSQASQSSYSIKPATLLITFFIFIVARAAVAIVNGQQQQLPTVIVRGFLNYRTTVDGTVLLFTPDAGQQASSTIAANNIQPTSTVALVPIASSATSAQPQVQTSGASLVFLQEHGIEPTSSLNLNLNSLQTSHVDSNSFRRGENMFAPAAHQPIAEAPEGPAENGQADEWRPIQATPPLRVNAQRETTEQPKGADEIASLPSIEITPTSATERARTKRPSLGFSGQGGFRARVPGTAGHATSPSLQTRPRAGTTGGINGIRRPGLTTTGPPTSVATAGHTNSATPSDPAALAVAANAFQNRLASANTRLKNRFKHRQHTTSVLTGAAENLTTPFAYKPANSLIAPDSLLDVASSIEQPTSAARSAALAPSGTSGQLGSSGPAVGSEEILAASPAAAGSLQGISPAADDSGAGITVPVVASPDVLAQADSAEMANPLDGPLSAEQQAGSASVSRAGEQRPTSDEQHEHPRVLSGQLQQGLLSSGPLQMETLIQNDQPVGQLLSSSSSFSSSVTDDATPPALARATHKSRPTLAKPAHHRPHAGNNNEKLNGWLGAHHNKFVPRPASKPADSEPGHLSHALAANLNQLLPSSPQPVAIRQLPLAASASTNASEPPLMSASLLPAASDSSTPASIVAGGNVTTSVGGTSNTTADNIMPMQTLTRTYSTILETSKTRLVPLQVNSTTAIYTITENYVMTKVMTAYQTLPVGGEFLLPAEQHALSTRAPYDVFESGSTSAESKPSQQQVAAAPSGGGREAPAPIDIQEQPISMETNSSPKSANNWLHDFSNPDDPLGGNDNFRSTSQEQTMLALLEQQARGEQPNLSQLLGGMPGEPLDQLASQLDPAALLADGTINIPDLNNPLVLAAAIQNPQLAAVILAAQQLKLKQRQQQQQRPNQNLSLQQLQQQLAQQAQQMQPSYSTSFSTIVRPSTYVARDTMYTTRLVSFRDGRTVRTRTVSEPGSVIEQTLTTIVTETIPVTISIKPTAVGSPLGVPNTATLSQTGGGGGGGGQQSNQATINNALFATQLANILARRQQATQLQTSFQSPGLMNLGAPSGGHNLAGAAATPQQLLALQQLFASRQKHPSHVAQQQQQQHQFQPNFNQLLASINQNQQAGTNTSSSTASQHQDQSQAASFRANPANSQDNQQAVQATPALQQAPKSISQASQPLSQINNNNNNNNNLNLGNQPLTTTLTSLQVRTYTVHNAFKTIFRTITSTVLIPTVLSPGATLLPMLG